MLDMGFIPDVERIVSLLPKLRQTLFFSATMPPEIKRLADRFLQNPKEVTVSPPASAGTNIVQGLVVVPEEDKREALRRLIKEPGHQERARVLQPQARRRASCRPRSRSTASTPARCTAT